MKTTMAALILVLIAACNPIQAPQNAFESPLARGARYAYYIPLISGLAEPTPTQTPTSCFKSPAAAEFYRLLTTDARQQRPTLICDSRLVAAAELRAKAQPSTGLSHCDSQNICANTYARAQGCRLPLDGYGLGNQIESLTAGTANAQAAFDSLARSPSHSKHLFGEIELFRQQDRVGIAMMEVPGHRYRWVWVVLIARCVSLAN